MVLGKARVMRNGFIRALAATLFVVATISMTGCGGEDVVIGGPTGPGGPGPTGGGADIDVTQSTPATGNTNISGSGVTVQTSSDTLNGTPVTRVQVDATSDGYRRRVLVYFETAAGTPRAVSYFWGVSDVNENIVYCPAAGCTGVTVNLSTKEIFFANTALDNNDPFAAPTKFATLAVGGIQYP